jgi:hypothetical protein
VKVERLNPDTPAQEVIGYVLERAKPEDIRIKIRNMTAQSDYLHLPPSDESLVCSINF